LNNDKPPALEGNRRLRQALSAAAAAVLRWGSTPAGRALIALVLVLLLGAVFNANGTFLKLNTHSTALRMASVYGILACGMTLVIVSGGIDLSVGSVLALGAVTFSLMSIHWGWPPWLGIPLCLCVGAACGGTSGVLAAKFKVQPFIATLAMMVFARGLAKMVSGQSKVATAMTKRRLGNVMWRNLSQPLAPSMAATS